MPHSIETRCIHGGIHNYQEDIRAISFPIYQTASFSHVEPGPNGSGFDYTRESNPTRSRLEETLSSLAGAADTVAFSSGMAAITACFELFRPGDRIVCAGVLYGGGVRLLHNIEEKNGLIVNKAKLWLDAGHIFGQRSAQFQRVVLACPRATLERALEQLRAAVTGE